MRIIVDINHPAHVHTLKYFITEMEKKGHNILITASKKDVTFELLNIYGFHYINIGSYGISQIQKLINIPILDLKMYKPVRNFKPDIFIGMGSCRAAHTSFLVNKPCVIFDDDEYSYRLYKPFASTICTTHTFNLDLGKKHVKFNGYKELAYLHPKYFVPDPRVLEDAGINRDEDFIIMRFVGWNALHDIRKQGLGDKSKVDYVKTLEKYARIFISSENPLPVELQKYKINLSPDKIHHVLYFAKLLIGDTQTMTTEAAVLGTPSIRCNSFVGKNDMLNFLELENKYGLIFNYKNPEKALQKAVEIVQNPDIKNIWKQKRNNMLNDKINVTSFMVWFIDNYPESFHKLKEDPSIQYQFR
jgi:predicted glycosyltransferase